MIENKRNLFARLRGWYIIYFGSILIAKEVGPYDFIPSILNNLLVWPAAVIGLLFIFCDVFPFLRKKEKFPYDKYLCLFMIVLIITTLVNRQYSFFANVKLLMNESIYFFVIYEFGKQVKNSNEIIIKFVKLLIVSWSVLILISVGMFLFQYQYSIVLENRFHPLRLGFVEGRLFGIFSDPNFASTICLVVIIMSCYFLLNIVKYKWMKVFLITNIIFQLLFIVLSGSRTGLLEVIAVILMGTFFYTYYRNTFKMKSKVTLFLYSGFIALFVSLFVYAIMNLVKQGLSYIPTYLSNLFHSIKVTGKVDLVRPDVGNSSDISNGRTNIWKCAIDLFKQNWLLGVGPSREGIVSYAKFYFPESVVAKTGLSLHSFIFQTLAGTGILGFLTFFSFFINKIFLSIKYCFEGKAFLKNANWYYLLCVVAISINAVLSSEIVLVNKIGAFIFWLFLGSIVSFISNKNESTLKG